MKLACPSCGENGRWTVDGVLLTLTLPSGEQVATAAGECRRCGSRVFFDPSKRAVADIGAREALTRSRVTQLRKTMAVRDG
jgi:DNA-directed RNA polymerase subunit RPC12/RpoP